MIQSIKDIVDKFETKHTFTQQFCDEDVLTYLLSITAIQVVAYLNKESAINVGSKETIEKYLKSMIDVVEEARKDILLSLGGKEPKK